LFLGLPTISLRQAAEDRLDSARARERRGRARRADDDDLLVLRADHPPLPRTAGAVHLVDELLDALDARRVRALAEVRHAGRRPLAEGSAVATTRTRRTGERPSFRWLGSLHESTR